jgi:hypothetical protein
MALAWKSVMEAVKRRGERSHEAEQNCPPQSTDSLVRRQANIYLGSGVRPSSLRNLDVLDFGIFLNYLNVGHGRWLSVIEWLRVECDRSVFLSYLYLYTSLETVLQLNGLPPDPSVGHVRPRVSSRSGQNPRGSSDCRVRFSSMAWSRGRVGAAGHPWAVGDHHMIGLQKWSGVLPKPDGSHARLNHLHNFEALSEISLPLQSLAT